MKPKDPGPPPGDSDKTAEWVEAYVKWASYVLDKKK
jgi:hypothetical protein